jgi:2-polyprenyl-3-methyl-5-hydroxy-6-metoxy-1,4-benzoquinol methylase
MSVGYFEDPRPDIQALIRPQGARILDVGCGAGVLSATLKRDGAAHVAGVEVEPDAAAQARTRLDQVLEGGALDVDVPFAPGEFDYLIFADVLEHLPSPEATLERYLRYLAPDGRVVVSVPNMRFYTVLLRLIFDQWSYTDAGIRDRTHLRIFTKRSLLRMLQNAGLEVEHLGRNYRLVEDQSEIGRTGAVATRIAKRTIAPWFFRNLMAFQYVAVCRRATPTPS